MSTYLKQSTAVTVQFGPFVDKTDGVTLEIGLAAAMDNATTGIRLSKNGGAFADRGDATVPVYDARGFYQIVLSTTDTGTLGTLVMVYEDATTCLPVWKEFQVVKANWYDTMCSTDYLEVDLIQVGGDTQSGTDLKDFADAGYDPGTNKVQGVVLVDTLTTYTGNTLQTADISTLITTVGVAGAGLTNINLPDQTMNITGDITGNLSGSVGSVVAEVTADVQKINAVTVIGTGVLGDLWRA
jgi:hypothetical protein